MMVVVKLEDNIDSSKCCENRNVFMYDGSEHRVTEKLGLFVLQ